MAQRFPQNITSRQGPLNLQYSTSDAMLAAGQAAFVENPSMSLYNYLALSRARNQNLATKYGDVSRVLSLEEQQERINSAEMTTDLFPSEGETDESLNLLIDFKREELSRKSVIANAREGLATTTGVLGSSLFASLLDPINVATAFVPFVGHAKYAAQLKQTASTFGRFSVRAKRGVVEGAVGTAYLEPIVYATAQDRQADYDLYDSFANLAFGSVLGGGIHGFGGILKDRFIPPVIERQVREAVEAASTEAKKSTISASVGQIATGRIVQGADYILRADLESSTALSRVYNPELGAVRTQIVDGVEDILDPVTLGGDATGTFKVGISKNLTAEEYFSLQKSVQNQDGLEAQFAKNKDGTYQAALDIPTELIQRTPEGTYLSFQQKKDATAAKKTLVKANIIDDGTVAKIGNEYFVLKTTDKNILETIKADAKNIVLPTELPGVRMSRIDTSTTEFPGPANSRVVPDIDYGADAVLRSHSPENRIFDFEERQTVEAAQRSYDNTPDIVDDVAVQREIDEALADVERLKLELEEDEFLKDAVQKSDEDMQAADNAIEEAKQTGDGYKQAAACILAGLF